jgi:multidrug resistance efflux pump
MKLSVGRLFLPLLAISLAGLGFYHVRENSQPASAAPPPASPARVPFDHVVAGSGVVEPRTENIAIGSALPGLVLEVFLPSSQVGRRIQAGTPLFRIDDRHLKAQLAVAQAQVISAKARLTRLQQQPRPEELPPSQAKVRATGARAAVLEDQYQRARRLISTVSISQEECVTKQQTYEAAIHDRAQAQAEYDLLKAGAWKPDLAIAEASVVEAEAKVLELKTEINRALVTAPVDGVLLQVNVRPGERIGEMDTKALMVLGDIDTFHVRADVDERDLPRFEAGVPAKAYPRGASSRELRLRFVRVEPYVVPKKALTGDNTERVDTRVLQVIYAIEPGQARVYVGQQLDVFIRSQE